MAAEAADGEHDPLDAGRLMAKFTRFYSFSNILDPLLSSTHSNSKTSGM
jgi:hypothetical protein